MGLGNEAAQFNALFDREALEHQQLVLRLLRRLIVWELGLEPAAHLREQQLDGARVARRTLVHQLLDHRLAFGDPLALAVLVHNYRFTERLQQELAST